MLFAEDAWEASWQGCFSAGMILQKESSLGELFLAGGCLGGRDFSDMLFSGLPTAAELSGEIISGRAFHCRGMHFAEGKHPWKSFSLQRDAFRKRKSSLGEPFLAEGCISRKEIIPERAFLCRGMHFAEGNHPWESFFLLRDALPHRIVIPDRAFS